MLLGQLGLWDGEEFFLELGLGCGIAKSFDGPRGRAGRLSQRDSCQRKKNYHGANRLDHRQ
jgi:hypothetical protein